MKSLRCSCAFLLCAIITGCATNAPRYTVNVANTLQLKSVALAPVKVGEITKDPRAKKDVDSLTIRGGKYSSPYGSFTAYLQAALSTEFDHADLLDPHSSIEIGGVLIRNELDGSGFSVGFAEIEARLVVKRGGAVAYDDVKATRYEWPSHFVGAVAIPRAIASYQITVQKLAGEFFADPAFLAALRK